VVFLAVVFKLLVWCGAEGYVSGLQDAGCSIYIYIAVYIYSINIPPIMIINRIYETQNLLSL